MPRWAHFFTAKAFIHLEAFVVFTTCNRTRNKQLHKHYLTDKVSRETNYWINAIGFHNLPKPSELIKNTFTS